MTTDRSSRAVGVVKRVKRYVYSPVESRDDWLRGPGRSYAEEILVSERLGAHGVMDPDGVRSIFDAQMQGGAHALTLGQLMNVELWQRLFMDGDALVGEAPHLHRADTVHDRRDPGGHLSDAPVSLSSSGPATPP